MVLTPPEVEKLLRDLCVRLGFCLPPDEQQRLETSPPADVRSFTDAVFVAEGLDPETASRNLYRQVGDLVTDAFRRTEERDA